MPLPDGSDTRWPPAEVQKPNKQTDTWHAWWVGDPAELSRVYGNTISTMSSIDPFAGSRPPLFGVGLRAQVTRMWWGRNATIGSLQESKVHCPLAGDIATTSADLLFGEPPALVIEDDDKTQARLDVIVEEAGLHAVLLEAAELAAALGGVYLRVGWDEQVADHPLLWAYPPDVAVPEWRADRLSAVTFWRELGRDANSVFRHLERHEPGRIIHGLYRGSDDKLGSRVSLGERPETEPYASVADAQGAIETGSQNLTAEYVPNMRPNRALRGSPLGRSDYAGIEPLMDALDEAWSSWLRDLRIGKARIIVPDVYLQSEGRGKGAFFDPEQSVFQAVNALPGGDNLQLQQVQFAIRVQEHAETCRSLAAQALRGAGYSAQTFGETGDVAVTATEVVARERRSYTTRARKINYWRSPLARLAETILAIDAAKFGSPVTPARPTLEWPDGVAVDPEVTARTLQLLQAAQAASTKTRVEMLHGEWDSEQVDTEVALIQQEQSAGMPQVADPNAMDAAALDTAGPLAGEQSQPEPFAPQAP